MSLTCGEATMRLLARYGVTTAFGVPGVHTLELCRGLTGGANAAHVRHVRARNEQGAGFMAEGWARATGEVGVAIVISGPGVTNATTAVGQCYADSLPMLLISAEPPSATLGKGWGELHEITSQKAVTAPMCAFSETARHPEDIPHLLARAFTIYSSARPRPCHISIPVDVQAMPVEQEWVPVRLPRRPLPAPEQVSEAASILSRAKRPLILAGGGAIDAAPQIRALTNRMDCPVVLTTRGKGIVPDNHPLALNVADLSDKGHELLASADVVLAIGTEMADTDYFTGAPSFDGEIIRIDIDPVKLTDRFPARVGICADAEATVRLLLDELPKRPNGDARQRVAAAKAEAESNTSDREARRVKLLTLLSEAAPEDTIWSGDPCQIVYTGCARMPVTAPRRWFYPVGFCSLGNAVPNAIGAKLARPEAPVVALVGDGGFMFTMPEILTAVDLGMALPIILWDNGGLQQIKDGFDDLEIDHVGVDGANPDFLALARACHCHAVMPQSAEELASVISDALIAARPTLIVVQETSNWLD